MASLNFLQRNLLVRGIRAGKTFEEAAKGLPLDVQRHPDLAKNWKAWAEAEAQKEDESTPKTVHFDVNESLRLREENEALRKKIADLSEDGALAAKVETLNADLAAERARGDRLQKDLTREASESAAKSAQIAKLEKEIESLVLDDGKGGKNKK